MSIGEWLVRRSMRESRDDGTIGRGGNLLGYTINTL